MTAQGGMEGPSWVDRHSRLGPRRREKEDGQRGNNSSVEEGRDGNVLR